MSFLSVKGLRFSGVNATEYRVYLLGNPVSLFLSFMLTISFNQQISVLMVKMVFRWCGG